MYLANNCSKFCKCTHIWVHQIQGKQNCLVSVKGEVHWQKFGQCCPPNITYHSIRDASVRMPVTQFTWFLKEFYYKVVLELVWISLFGSLHCIPYASRRNTICMWTEWRIDPPTNSITNMYFCPWFLTKEIRAVHYWHCFKDCDFC